MERDWGGKAEVKERDGGHWENGIRKIAVRSKIDARFIDFAIATSFPDAIRCLGYCNNFLDAIS